ncbi:MAG TPA: ferrous iron transport protein A [Treponema sp.]|nr:ferrous iron transport protein A [Treponema sp.]
MSLTMLENGRSGVVVRINGGRTCRCRLLQLGIVPGVPVSVIKNAGQGPLVLDVLGSRIMLGCGIASSIEVA